MAISRPVPMKTNPTTERRQGPRAAPKSDAGGPPVPTKTAPANGPPKTVLTGRTAVDDRALKEMLARWENNQGKWHLVGRASMGPGQLVIDDPAYTVARQEAVEPPEFTYDDCCQPYAGDPGYLNDAKQHKFRLGHPGAGICIHPPYGDGRVNVYARLTKHGTVTAVFFSFHEDLPPGFKALAPQPATTAT